MKAHRKKEMVVWRELKKKANVVVVQRAREREEGGLEKQAEEPQGLASHTADFSVYPKSSEDPATTLSRGSDMTRFSCWKDHFGRQISGIHSGSR